MFMIEGRIRGVQAPSNFRQLRDWGDVNGIFF